MESDAIPPLSFTLEFALLKDVRRDLNAFVMSQGEDWLKKISRRLDAHSVRIVLARDVSVKDFNVLGYVFLSSATTCKHAKTDYIVHVFVRPDVRLKGVGAKMLRLATERIPELRGECNSENHGFYRRMGAWVDKSAEAMDAAYLTSEFYFERPSVRVQRLLERQELLESKRRFPYEYDIRAIDAELRALMRGLAETRGEPPTL